MGLQTYPPTTATFETITGDPMDNTELLEDSHDTPRPMVITLESDDNQVPGK